MKLTYWLLVHTSSFLKHIPFSRTEHYCCYFDIGIISFLLCMKSYDKESTTIRKISNWKFWGLLKSVGLNEFIKECTATFDRSSSFISGWYTNKRWFFWSLWQFKNQMPRNNLYDIHYSRYNATFLHWSKK